MRPVISRIRTEDGTELPAGERCRTMAGCLAGRP